ncbi:MAG: DEAD/DEAH box helicase [Desulfobacterales bacterium]|nr:DEAD/DEAH box helicase [Desulfobacterales bacterium]MDJ0887230.1 DEAD/DEAH box helicase [Desulfobacterales bacterium]MDJ0989090.1 DEAD/DEAH box helicase [Desulfobacterales bacterium]
MDFKTFEFHPQVAAGIAAAGYSTPTPIQARAIPAVMQGRDVMGLAQTGTGKTAAFALPILNRLIKGRRGTLRALVVAPTRELAEQINAAFQTLGRKSGLRSTTVYGGVGINPQINRLRRGVDILVACPGRLLDHIDRRTVDLSRLEVLVLDEADQMFDMGFFPDIRRIVARLPDKRQTLLFSATMPEEIKKLTREVLHRPTTVQVDRVAPAVTVSHALYPVAPHLKTAALLELLQHTDTASVLVFTRTKHRARTLGRKLENAGYRAASLQGNLSQNRRRAALDGFRDGTFQMLVATDIAARGIDVSRVSHVINYDIPDTPEAYIHRIGRTGRAARSGDAFTLATPEDKGMVRSIERVLGAPLERRYLEDFDYLRPAPRRDGEFSRPPRTASRNRRPAWMGKGTKPGGGHARRRPFSRTRRPRKGSLQAALA